MNTYEFVDSDRMTFNSSKVTNSIEKSSNLWLIPQRVKQIFTQAVRSHMHNILVAVVKTSGLERITFNVMKIFLSFWNITMHVVMCLHVFNRRWRVMGALEVGRVNSIECNPSMLGFID